MSDKIEETSEETKETVVETSEKTTYGIDNIKKVLAFGITIVSKVEIAKEDDGKVDFWEAAGIAAGSVTDIFNIVKNGSQLKNEYFDLDAEERNEITEWFVEKFDLADENAEVIIEAVFEWVIKTDEIIGVIRENM